MDMKIVNCKICGKYLGDRIDGTLYKAGKPVPDDHQYCWMATSKEEKK